MALRFISRSTFAYRFVVVGLACPSKWLMVERSTPDFRSATAVLCRTLWDASASCGDSEHSRKLDRDTWRGYGGFRNWVTGGLRGSETPHLPNPRPKSPAR